MPPLKPSSFPLDESKSFTPDKVFYIERSDGLASNATIKDIPTALDSTDFLKAAADAAKAIGPVYTTTSTSRFPPKADLFSSADPSKAVASLHTSLWGIKTISFTTGPSHAIEMQAVAVGRKDEAFAVESVPYFWTTDSATRHVLTRVAGPKRVVVGEYAARRGYGRTGVLRVESEGVDEVVAVATCLALLNRVDSFSTWW